VNGSQNSGGRRQEAEFRRQETGSRIKVKGESIGQKSPVKSSFGGLPMAAFNRASRRQEAEFRRQEGGKESRQEF
jgi:hypothetical protein